MLFALDLKPLHSDFGLHCQLERPCSSDRCHKIPNKTIQYRPIIPDWEAELAAAVSGNSLGGASSTTTTKAKTATPAASDGWGDDDDGGDSGWGAPEPEAKQKPKVSKVNDGMLFLLTVRCDNQPLMINSPR